MKGCSLTALFEINRNGQELISAIPLMLNAASIQSKDLLQQTLRRIDGRGYKAYKELEGQYDFGDYLLSVDHVQGDPFAAPSRFTVELTQDVAGFPQFAVENKVRRQALGDFLGRAFRDAIRHHAGGSCGTGHSGVFRIDAGRQEILERTSVVVTRESIQARFTVGLPATGRRILGEQARSMIFDVLPRIARDALCYRSLAPEQLDEHLKTAEDQEALREQLSAKILVAFVANGAVLPRRSGIDDRPLEGVAGQVVISFQSPPELECEMARPHHGPIRGMGIPSGITLIAGGGFHGKSTLLRALQRGIYNHIPGDGREWVVTVKSAVKIRAEEGRSVERVDISPFIRDLPFEKDTHNFSTENASGSTSQAANIMEALEAGARLLLVDEDTSASNFILRDARMQALVPKHKEPITPFIDKVGQLWTEHGVSTVLVMGGSGDYFEVADRVIVMENYLPHDATDSAKEIARKLQTRRVAESGAGFGVLPNRRPQATSFDARRGRKAVKVEARGLNRILFGREEIDLFALEQLADESQTRAIAYALLFFSRHYAANGIAIRDGIEAMQTELDKRGLDILAPYRVGNLARPRPQEIAFAMNRLRTLRIR